MIKKVLFFTVFMTSVMGSVKAQQDKILTHFIFDKMSINPGATGIDLLDGFCGTMIYRNQWDKVVGAPNSFLFNGEANLTRYFPSGVGISYYQDRIGFNVQNNLTANYSYHLTLGDGLLGLGAGVGLVSYAVDANWETPDTPAAQDGLLNGSNNQSQGAFDANFGLYYKSNKGWYAGLSATHLTQPELKNINFTPVRNYYAMGGYTWFSVFMNDLDIEGNVLLRSDGIKASSDLNVRAIYNDFLYAGLTYRTSDALGIMLGAGNYQIGSIPGRISGGYSYDITLNRLKGTSWGSHELFVKYCYDLPPVPRSVTKNPRWL